MHAVSVVVHARRRPWRAVLTAAFVLAGLTVISLPALRAAAAEESAIDVAIDRYVQDVKAAAADAIRPLGYQTFLLTQARLAQSFADQDRLCLAEGVLQRLRRDLGRSLTTNGVPELAADLAAQLSTDVLNIEALLLSSPETSACGGATLPTSPTSAPLAIVTSADNQQVTFHVAFPQARFISRQGGGQQFLQLIMSGTGNGGERAIGTPELPMTGKTVAVPQEASVSVQVLGTSSYQLPAVQLWPVQPETPAAAPDDELDEEPLPPGPAPFTINEAAYALTNPIPAALASAGAVESMRRLPLSGISLAGAQYLPATRLLTILTGMDVQVTFGGRSTGRFGTTDLISVWNLPFQNIYQRAVLNWGAAKQYLDPEPLRPDLFCGEEMMVITAAALEPAAVQFANDRTAHGVRARVFVVGARGGIGTTPAAIRDAIAQEYNSPDCELRPSYVTIVGDTPLVPTFEFSYNSIFFEDPVATDMLYGFIHQAAQVDNGFIIDYAPDLLVGRLPATDLATAQTEVATITAYEDQPPLVSDAYDTVLANSFFQPCPDLQCKNGETPSSQDSFPTLRVSELAGTAATFAGKTIRRVYADESDVDIGLTINPLYYDDGTPLSSDVKLALATLHGHTRDEIKAAVTAAVNDGAFLIWHSDHGDVDGGGWYEPRFTRSLIWETILTPALPPVLWDIDCDSGKFDDPDFPNVVSGYAVSFTEQWLEQGSAVATIGASRESPALEDSIMLQSAGAALFPELQNALSDAAYNFYNALAGGSLPPYQPLQPVTQVGPLLLASKLAVRDAMGVKLYENVYTAGTWIEYNEFGDPSMAIRRDAPTTFIRASVSAALVGAHSVVVQTTQEGLDGAVVTLTLDGEYIGRGLFQGGTATIDVPGGLETLDGVQAVLAGDETVPITVELAATPPRSINK